MDLKDIDALIIKLNQELNLIKNAKELEGFRLKYLARKGELNDCFEKLKELSVEQKRVFGPKLNTCKKELEQRFKEKQSLFDKVTEEFFFDYTLPGKKKEIGSLHPTTLTYRHIISVFNSFGFEIFESNDIESEYYNFDSLNIEKNHPARDMWDTF